MNRLTRVRGRDSTRRPLCRNKSGLTGSPGTGSYRPSCAIPGSRRRREHAHHGGMDSATVVAAPTRQVRCRYAVGSTRTAIWRILGRWTRTRNHYPARHGRWRTIRALLVLLHSGHGDRRHQAPVPWAQRGRLYKVAARHNRPMWGSEPKLECYQATNQLLVPWKRHRATGRHTATSSTQEPVSRKLPVVTLRDQRFGQCRNGHG